MNPDQNDELEPRAKLAVQSYVHRLLRNWAVWFGVVNVLALVGAFAWLYVSVAETAVQKVIASARIDTAVQDARTNLGRVDGRVGAMSEDLSRLGLRLAEIESNVRAFKGTDAGKLTSFAKSLADYPDAAKALSAITDTKKVLDCKTVEKKSSPGNEIQVVARDSALVKDGYRLVSGGCRYDHFENVDKTLTLTSAPLDEDGWHCWYKNPRPTTVTAVARYCRIVASP